jgi:nicotinamidase/pyrazinamidase
MEDSMDINRKTDVLVIVDFQNDFITGSLAITGAENLVTVINDYIRTFRKVLVSRDHHKPGHPSFVDQSGPWPDHCVDGTFGMEIHSSIEYTDGIEVAYIDKGWDEEAYSAFDGTDITGMLRDINAKRLFICGLATDYCVKATVLDALKEFKGEVYLLTNAIAAVNINPDDGENAIKEMEEAGAKLTAFSILR